MHIFLPGAGGQLGHAIQGIFSHHEIVAYDRQQLDITDLDAVRVAVATHAPDLVLNAAAYNAVDQAERDPEAAYRANALAFQAAELRAIADQAGCDPAPLLEAIASK